MNRILYIILIIFLPIIAFGQKSEPLFKLLSPKKTKVKFKNTIKDKKEHSILLYSNYYGGAGVGVGDFNNDGLQDLYFAGNLVADKLYLNTGNLTFDDVTKSAGIENNGGWSSGVLVADVNNDGWQDIYVTRELYDDKPELRRNILYINNGVAEDGKVSFTEKAKDYGIDNSERTRHATFIDYNKDGFLDLFLLNQPPNPGNYSPYSGTELRKKEWAPRLYKNEGNGTFSDVTEAAGMMRPCYPNSVIAADLNNDGWQDLYISNDYEAPDLLFMNNQDGTFTNKIYDAVRHISYYSMGVDAADINNDGNLDVMTLDMVAEDNYRLKANMGGMYPDRFWNIVKTGGHHQYMFNALHLNNGNGTFSDIAQIAGVSSTDWSWANVIADFDNDGWKDIYVTNGLLRDIRNSDASKEFPKYVSKTIQDYIKANPNVGDISIFDILNLDEALGLLPSEPLKNYAYKNMGNLHFEKVTDDWGLKEKTFSNGVSYADLDNDGDLDLIVSNINEVAYIYENTSLQNNWISINLTDKEKNQTFLGTRVYAKTASGEQMIEVANVRGMYSTSDNRVHFGLNNQTKVELRIEWNTGKTTILENQKTNQFITIDINNVKAKSTKKASEQPLFENVTRFQKLTAFHIENEFDDYEKQILLPHKMSQFGPALAKGDVNGDGLEDIYVGGAAKQTGVIFQQAKDGTFAPMRHQIFINDANYEDTDAIFLDVDNDKDLDLYVVSGGNSHTPQNKMYQDRLYLNNGTGEFEAAKLPIFRESGSCVRPFDFDNDGDLDLLIGGRHTPWDYPSPAISRLLRNDNGIFKDITVSNAKDLAFVGMVTDAVWTDFDGDSDMDFILVGEWMPITCFENQDGHFKKIKHPSFKNTTGWWYSIEASDIDNDGDDDYFVGN